MMEEDEEVLTACKTPSFHTNLTMVPGRLCPEVDLPDPQRLVSECVHCMSTFQDGDSSFGLSSGAPFRLDVLDRSRGRIS